MNYCTKCGKKLAQQNAKYCPACGRALKAVAEAPPVSMGQRLRLIFAVAIVFFAFLFIAFYLPGSHWQRVEAAGTQYYSYLTIFSNDVSDLNALSKMYDGVPLNNATIARKTAVAGNYSLKARQALTSWNYFASFMTQNNGLLKEWSVDTASAQQQIQSANATVQSKAKSMASELEKIIPADPAVKSLKELSQPG